MSYFLWIEDFENSPQVTAQGVFGNIVKADVFSDNKHQLKKNFKNHGVFIELNFQDGLSFIRENLPKIDYVILDIDLPAYSEDDEINADVLQLLSEFQDYEKIADEAQDEALIAKNCKQLKAIAGFYLYTELVVELGFPKQHILFCSNHAENAKTTRDAFKAAKIALPRIYEKANPEVDKWVQQSSENPYSQLRRGVIEGCRNIAECLSDDSLIFNSFINESEKQVSLEDMRDFLNVLANFLPIREPNNKEDFYKLFIRTLTHEWEAADPRKIKDLAWIMKTTRNWIAHNSALFNTLDEKMIAYLFLINMRVMFNLNEHVQPYEKILLNLFKEEALPNENFKDINRSRLMPISKAYSELKNIALDKNSKEAFQFRTIANNLLEDNSTLKNDPKLFSKVLYQMFWLNTSRPIVSTGRQRNVLEIDFLKFNYAEKPYIFELARHIYHQSFSSR